MADRIHILHKLISNDGTLFVHIDDNEMGYLIVLLDEIFGRNNRLYIATFKQGSATGHKSINPGCVNTTNFIIIYARNKNNWAPNPVFTARERDKRYNQFVKCRDNNYKNWQFCTVTEAFAESEGLSLKDTRTIIKKNPESLDSFVINNPQSVIQFVRPNYNAVSAAARELIDISKDNPTEVFLLEREGFSDMYFMRGQRIIFYADKLKYIDGKYVAGEPLTTLWDDLLSNNLHKEGDVRFPKGKKPEALIKRCLEISTNPGDLVLDSFLGSGTTAAVAHKMGRRWIGVELGDHCETHCLPRLKKVVDGEDPGGITKSVNWQGGGGFRYYRLGPSLIAEDEWGNPVINPEFNPAMLAEAMCKLEGFRYVPSDEIYWIHGRSTESDYIYVCTQFMSREMLTRISDEVGPERSLLICCTAFKCTPADFPNLTIKKIPKAVLKKCEWGHDDYSLEVNNLPSAPEPETEETDDSEASKSSRGTRQQKLF